MSWWVDNLHLRWRLNYFNIDLWWGLHNLHMRWLLNNFYEAAVSSLSKKNEFFYLTPVFESKYIFSSQNKQAYLNVTSMSTFDLKIDHTNIKKCTSEIKYLLFINTYVVSSLSSMVATVSNNDLETNRRND